MSSHQAGKPAAYQTESQQLLRELDAEGIVLIVHKGKRGNGMSVSAVPGEAFKLHSPEGLSRYLRGLADIIDGGIGPSGVHLETEGD